MEITIVVILLVLGIVFLLLEIFMFPGISVAGVAGAVFTTAAVWYAYTHIGAVAGNIALIGGVVLMGVAVWMFMRSRALDKMSLKTSITGTVEAIDELKISVGDKGTTISRLAPMGKIKINGKVVEAKTDNEFIDPNTEVMIKEVYKTNVLVGRGDDVPI